MSAPLSSLELRLKYVNRLCDAQNYFLKGLYDGGSIVKRYCLLKIEIHLHFGSGNEVFCAICRYSGIRGSKFRARMHEQRDSAPNVLELPMFIFVRKSLERLCPIASLIRLQPLYCCDMGDIDALEPSSLNPPLESLSFVFYRKLRAILSKAGVEPGKLENEIIKSRSQVIAKFADVNWEAHGRSDRHRDIAVAFIRRPGVRLEISDKCVSLFNSQIVGEFPDVSKVFICPSDPLGSAIKRMRRHDILYG